MSTGTSAFTHILALASAMGLALTPTCEGNVDFEALNVGEQVARQYADAPGIEFMTNARCVGAPGPECVPVTEGWRNRCEQLPTVIAEPGAHSGSKAANINHGALEFRVNAVCGRLSRPARRLRLHVRNAPQGGHASVMLAVLDAAGAEIGQTVRAVPGGTGYTPMEIRVPGDRIYSFVLWGPRDAVLAIDDVSFEQES
jgi:hypothetical protein